MKKVLITGGAGFIGAGIVKNLITKNYNVKVLDNLQRGELGKLQGYENKLVFIRADVRDADKVVKAAKNCDAIVHLAYVNGTKTFYEKPDLVLDIAIRGMQSVIEAGKQNDIKELYLASSSEVYQEPPSLPTPENVRLIIPDPYNPRFSYGGGKILSELMAIHTASKVFRKVIIFRPHNVYGPNMGYEHVIPEMIKKIKKIKNNSALQIQGSGKETRSYIYIDDFADAFYLLLKSKEKLNTYNIGDQNEIASKDLAVKIAKLMNKNVNIIPGKLMPGSTPRRCPNVGKIKKLGFKTRYSLEKGLIKTIDWYTN